MNDVASADAHDGSGRPSVDERTDMPREPVVTAEADDERRARRRPAAALAARSHRPESRRAAAGHRAQRLQEAQGAAAAHPLRRPARPGQDHLRHRAAQRAGHVDPDDQRPGPDQAGDLLPFLTNAEEGSILFIDEIHRMPRVVEEFIYPAMEDFRVDIVLGEGINARTISMPLKRFTLIGATTRSGMLSSPMRDRFKMHEHLEFYTVEELAQIVTHQRPQAADPDQPTTPPWNWPAAAAARRASPTPGCGGPGTTPPARPTAASRWTSPGPPWTWPRWTAMGWTSRTAAIWKR